MIKVKIKKIGSLLVSMFMVMAVFSVLPQNKLTVSAAWSSVAELESYALQNWVKPIRASYLDINSGSRYFGANRSGTTRKHAANDYVCAVGTPVYAMTGGYVEEYSPNFYGGTQAISVKNDDGSVARYCEISTSFRSGNRVEKGQQIGTVIANNIGGSHMLHLEMYLGTTSGSLTNTSNSDYWYVSYKNYCRRQDLIDPSFVQNIGNGNPIPDPDPDPVVNNDNELGIDYPRPTGNPLLKSGSAGSGVSWLQSALNKADDAGLAVDGQFGNATKTAVTNFQSAYGLGVDGIAGPATINKLVEVLKNKVSVVPQIHHWVSPTKMGSTASSPETYNWYYICYELLDKNTENRLNAVTSKYNDYTVTESVYSPDGSLFHTFTYTNSDNNWIGFKPSAAGTYKYTIEISGNGLSWSGGKSFEVVDHTHSYSSWTITKSATCTEDGSKKRTCSVCGASETAITVRTGHSFSGWTTTTSATCTTDGLEKRTCSRCGKTEKQILEAKHTIYDKIYYEDGHYIKKCEKCDYQENVLDSDGFAVDFVFDHVEAYPGDTVTVNLYADTHDKLYAGCCIRTQFDKDILTITDFTPKDTMSKTTINPPEGIIVCSTAYASEYKKNVPDTPFITYTFKISENALPGDIGLKLTGTNGHNYVEYVTVDSSGKIVSNLLGTISFDNVITVKCPHQYTTKVIDPTCTEEGYTLRTCSICGYSYKSNYVDEKGHHYTNYSTVKSATCTTDGQKLGKCSDCGTINIAVIPSIGHQYDSTVIAPSYTADGYTLHVCSVCGDSYKDDYIVKEKGDLNNDSYVYISDIVKLQQYLSNSATLTEEQYTAADMNNDGLINVFDAIIIRRKILETMD